MFARSLFEDIHYEYIRPICIGCAPISAVFYGALVYNYLIPKVKTMIVDFRLSMSSTWAQVAYEFGCPLEDALKFKNKAQFFAWQKGMPTDDALKFTDEVQLLALDFLGIPLEEALQVNHIFSITAFKAGVPFGKALNVQSFDKLQVAFELYDTCIDDNNNIDVMLGDQCIDPHPEFTV